MVPAGCSRRRSRHEEAEEEEEEEEDKEEDRIGAYQRHERLNVLRLNVWHAGSPH